MTQPVRNKMASFAWGVCYSSFLWRDQEKNRFGHIPLEYKLMQYFFLIVKVSSVDIFIYFSSREGTFHRSHFGSALINLLLMLDLLIFIKWYFNYKSSFIPFLLNCSEIY